MLLRTMMIMHPVAPLEMKIPHFYPRSTGFLQHQANTRESSPSTRPHVPGFVGLHFK